MERTLPGQTAVTSYAHAKKFKELRTKEAHDSEVKELLVAKNLFTDSERACKPKRRRMQCPEGGTVTPDGHTSMIIRVAQTRRPLRAHLPAAALLRLGVRGAHWHGL